MQKLTKNDLTEAQKYRALSIFCVYLFFSALFELFMLLPIHALYQEGMATGLSATCFGLFFIFAFLTAKRIGLPWRCYGFIKPSLKSVFETIVSSLVFCAFVIFVKVLVIKYDPQFAGGNVIVFLSPKVSQTMLLEVCLLYSLFCPIQALIFHGFTEGPLIDLLDIRARAFVTIGLSTMFFTSIHLFISVYLMVLVFPVILFWCILYYRHRCVWTIAISHILIGGILLTIVGMDPFYTIIQQTLHLIMNA